LVCTTTKSVPFVVALYWKLHLQPTVMEIDKISQHLLSVNFGRFELSNLQIKQNLWSSQCITISVHFIYTSRYRC
jgi:hypothetical protein